MYEKRPNKKRAYSEKYRQQLWVELLRRVKGLSTEDKKVNDFCEWYLDADDNEYYQTDCGEHFCFIHDVDNWLEKVFKYCPFCGLPIKFKQGEE